MNKMSYTSGFTLIEFLIYLTLVSFTVVLTTRFALTCYERMQTSDFKINIITEFASAYDALSSELSRAPTEKRQWKMLGPSMLVWHDNTVDYGWAIEKGYLVRREGTFNETENRWQTSRQSVIADNSADITFQPIIDQRNEQHIRAIHFVLKSTTNNCNQQNMVQTSGTILLENRIIYDKS